MHRNQSVNQHQFAMIPRADIPRSAFNRQTAHKTTINSGFLIPFFVDEALPGDVFNMTATIFGRLATPLVPVMDNIYADTFYFFCPARLLWENWTKMNGEQANPGDSISYTVPQMVSPPGGYTPNTIFDYMGLPTVGQVTAGLTVSHNSLPLRAYNRIWNDWFRDENLQNSAHQQINNGPDTYSNYNLLRRGKRKDYFTSALPFAQKGAAVPLPIGSTAPVITTGVAPLFTGGYASERPLVATNPANTTVVGITPASTSSANLVFGSVTGLYTDLSSATASTVTAIRTAFQIQKLLERDARGGTRYSELLQSHFGVRPQDYRLQRPEYLGGGSTPININPIAQQSGTGASGTATPLGQLAAMGTLLTKNNGFRYSVMEHGYIIGLVSVRADLTYQQGLRKMWSRQTRYDFYMPVFAMLGEQAVLNKEIYVTGDTTQDNLAFGYQERWAEYRYFPAMITGQFKSTTASPLDIWHVAQRFTSLPLLNDVFIREDPPINRIVAVPSQPQFLLDVFMNVHTVRALPMYSVPGLVDHF